MKSFPSLSVFILVAFATMNNNTSAQEIVSNTRKLRAKESVSDTNMPSMRNKEGWVPSSRDDDKTLRTRRLESSRENYCSKDSYARLFAGLPNECPVGKERVGSFYYSKCPSGYQRHGVECHQQVSEGTISLEHQESNSVIVDPNPTPVCPDDQEMDSDGSQCFKPCNFGYMGRSSECQTETPSGWVDCGIGAASNMDACATVQASSLEEMAVMLSSNAAGSTSADQIFALQSIVNSKNTFTYGMLRVVKAYRDLSWWLSDLAPILAGELASGHIGASDTISLVMQLTAILDPSHEAFKSASFIYKTCDIVF